MTKLHEAVAKALVRTRYLLARDTIRRHYLAWHEHQIALVACKCEVTPRLGMGVFSWVVMAGCITTTQAPTLNSKV